MSSIVTFITIISAVIIGNILCTEVNNNRNTHQNAWQHNWSNATNTQYVNTQQFGKKSPTTPWPALGRQRYQNNVPSSTRAPLWVRPNNGPSWVRNTPSPQQNSNFQNTRTQTHTNNFLNNEREIVNEGKSANLPNRNTDRFNNNNGINSVFSSGSMMSETRDSHRQNQGSNGNQNSDVSDDELRQFSEELLNRDNSPAQYVSVNFQGMTSSRSTNDEAPLPLLSIDQAAYSMPSISKLTPLYNNYIVETNQNEVYTAQEKNEENDLLGVVLSTPVMQHTRNFLISKGKIGRDPQEFKELLRLIWFNMYSRGQGKIGSSGFEHVFLGELKNNQVSGLHNWVYFGEEEKKHEINYLGYMKKIDLGGKGFILKFHFTFHGVDKPVDSMFVGTSPELEMALYSTCFILRADRVCPLKMNGNRFIIRTYTFRYRGKNMIGSAFAEI
ncbi:unnamed protein product [Psylliodes chrysocephalus]|uniref:EndoU domain-containing protein n=1 Tax=Psylliodes chrysocephalus TaxID=3402493 RepID=A0A9P0GH94_9CUCU|nr:unnamed protein product [Psylliodes chrysocephala]